MKKRIFIMTVTSVLLFSSPLLTSAEENINWNTEFKRADQITLDTKKNLNKIVQQKLEPSAITDSSSSTVSTTSTSQKRFKPKTGQILATLDNGSSSFRWGHAGILRSSTKTIEAWPKDENHKNGVYEYPYKEWETKVKNYLVLNIKKAKPDQYKKAASFAVSKIKKPYRLRTTKNSDNAYYCSKLVYRSWKSSKVNLDRGNLAFVAPSDLILDNDTKVAYQKGVIF